MTTRHMLSKADTTQDMCMNPEAIQVHRHRNINLAADNRRYKYFVCPRHSPIVRPRHPLLLPPELLLDIFARIASGYLYFLFAFESQDDDEIEECLAVNPFLVFLHVSHQFRELAFKVVEDVFGIDRDPDGSLPKDAWSCLRYVMKYAHLLQHSTQDAVEEHVKQGSSYEVPPILKDYLYIATLACTARDRGQLEGALTQIMEDDTQWRGFLELKTSAILQAPLFNFAYGVLWSLKFRFSMLPVHRPGMRRIPVDYDEKDLLLRSCYSIFYIMSGVQYTDPGNTLLLEGWQHLVPVKISIPQSVNAELINRFKFLSLIWHFQSCPIMAADRGLMQMSQSVVDYCLAVVMPKRPLTSKTSPRRRASLSALHDMRAKPRSPLKPPCHCERRLFL